MLCCEVYWWGSVVGGGLGTAALASGRAEHRSRETNEQTETQIRDKTIEKYTSISSDGEEAGLWDGHGVMAVCRQRNVAVMRWRRTVLNPILSHRVKLILTVGGGVGGCKNYKLKKKEKKTQHGSCFMANPEILD